MSKINENNTENSTNGTSDVHGLDNGNDPIIDETNDDTVSTAGGDDDTADKKDDGSVINGPTEPSGKDASIDADAVDAESADNGKNGITLREFFLSWRLIVIILVFALAIGGPITWLRVIRPAMSRGAEENIASSSVVMYDHTWEQNALDESVTDSLNVNENQWVLSYTSAGDADGSKNILDDNDTIERSSSTRCLVFRGARDDASTDGNVPKHHARAVLSFGDEKSRNFIMEQSETLAYGMKKGVMSMEFCFLLNSDEYSAIALEALGEIDYNDPSFTWDAITRLAQVDTSELEDTDDMVSAVLNVVSKLEEEGLQVDKSESSISEKSLKTGSFIQWARIMTNENTVEVIPAFFMDGENLSNTETFKMYNPDAMYEKIQSLG